MNTYGIEAGLHWRNYLPEEEMLQKEFDRVRNAFRYVLKRNPLLNNQDARDGITQCVKGRGWSEETYAEILQTLLSESEFENHESYPFLLHQLAVYFRVIPEREETKFTKSIGHEFPVRNMLRDVFGENDLPLPSPEEILWR